MMALAIGTGAGTAVHRWQGLDGFDRPQWSLQQTTTARHWRVALAAILSGSWAYMAIVLIDRALTPGIAASLPKAIGWLPLPAWLAFGLTHRGLWFLLWATAAWFSSIPEKTDVTPRPFKPVYGLICFLIAVSIVANAASIWS